MADNTNYGGKAPTTTLIRTLMAKEMSSIRLQFFNMKVSFQFNPYAGKQPNGLDNYDTQNALTTTIDHDAVAMLYHITKGVLEGSTQWDNMIVQIPCREASITFERKPGDDGVMTSWISIQKNGVTIPFRFDQMAVTVTENGQQVQKNIDAKLAHFNRILDGILVGINSSRHLNKLTDDYVKSLGGDNKGGFQTNSGWKGGNKGGGNWPKKQFNNNQGGGNNWGGGQQQQNMSSYQPG